MPVSLETARRREWVALGALILTFWLEHTGHLLEATILFAVLLHYELNKV
jgi:hypothetical protein